MNLASGRTAARRATAIGIAGNATLFAVKTAVAVMSGSIALLSDAFNSLVDVVASIAIYWSVQVSHREPDADHPFGHHRAETIAALGVAIFTAILGFEIGRAAVERLIDGPAPIRAAAWAVGALVLSMAGNLALARYLRRRGTALESPAILANAFECENDIWASLAALVGVVGAILGWPAIDPMMGIVVGGWIVWGGYRFGRQNIDYLMGKSPAREMIERIRATALAVPGVRGLHDVRAHYVGHHVHVELHIEVDQELRTRQSHDVAGAVRHAVEHLSAIDRAFVHVDPVPASTLVLETLARRERAASRLYVALARRYASRPSVAALWEALATGALARAERLDATQRLRGAGLHFADTEVEPRRAEASLERLEALEARALDGDIGQALAVAAEIEAAAAQTEVRLATTPRDPRVEPSLAAATPPPPAPRVLLERIAAARTELAGDPAGHQGLESLAALVSGSDEPRRT
ncbi:MAG: cation diffusion facilitator family transporter [Gemmatimonadota bacterium]